MAKKRKKPTPPPAEEPIDDAPGWHAIDAVCEGFYPDQADPLHVASVPHPPFGDGLLYGISIYRANDPIHWHFVTYGFSELYTKDSDDPNVSGWGFELTFRLTRGKEETPPNWAINVLMNLGRYVRRSGNSFASGSTMDLNGPIELGTTTAIRAIAFAEDLQLGTINTPNGQVQFLQVVGLTLDEHDACADWHASNVVAILREANPLLITDLDRRSVLEKPVIAARIQKGIDREGSQTGGCFVSVVDWAMSGRGKKRTATVTLGAKRIKTLLSALRSRLAHGRDFTLMGRERAVRFQMSEQVGWEKDGTTLVADFSPAALAVIRASLKPIRGEYRCPEFPGLTIEVQPSLITDDKGNVIEVVG